MKDRSNQVPKNQTDIMNEVIALQDRAKESVKLGNFAEAKAILLQAECWLKILHSGELPENNENIA